FLFFFFFLHPSNPYPCLSPSLCPPFPLQRLGCDNILESPQQEDPCLQCGGNGQSCYPVRTTFNINNLPNGYNQMFIIPVGATSIRIREAVATRNYLGECFIPWTTGWLMVND
uniref:Uncharacterized protein n=1 Tax=Hucho hucho TaxID=62062 RepID=A0A4W5KTR2_9TELE